MDKYWFTYDDIHRTVRDLALRVEASGFAPEAIVAIGSGGFIPARILRTFLKKPIWAVGIAYYDERDQPTELPRKVQWLDEVERQLKGRRVLLIDEVDDTRATLAYCVRELLRHDPVEVAVAVLHNKRKAKKDRLPEAVRHYFAGHDLEDRWIKYPWDAEDIAAQNAEAVRASGSR